MDQWLGLTKGKTLQMCISAGGAHAVGLKSDGTTRSSSTLLGSA
jgi:hypothetical protein